MLKGQNMIFKFWLIEKHQLQVTKFNPMAFSSQGVLRHDYWCFIKMRLKYLQWKKNGIKWIFELKVEMSQSWEKEVDFPYLEIFQVFLHMLQCWVHGRARLSILDPPLQTPSSIIHSTIKTTGAIITWPKTASTSRMPSRLSSRQGDSGSTRGTTSLVETPVRLNKLWSMLDQSMIPVPSG